MESFLTKIPIAHRGLHGEEAPENSLPAFLAAIQHGYAIETDVRFTKDRQLVVFHDDDLMRMTGDPRPVLDCTYEELPPLATCPPPSQGWSGTLLLNSPVDCERTATGASENADRPHVLCGVEGRHEERKRRSTDFAAVPAAQRGAGEGVRPQTESKPTHIPLFSEFLETVGGRVPLLIEIKNMPKIKGEEVAAAMVALLKDYHGEYAVQSFNPLYVKAYKKLTGVPCGVLGSAEKGAARGVQGFMIKHMPLNFWVKPDFLSYRKEDLPRRKVERFKGVKLAWVVRSESEALTAKKFVDNIIFEHFLP